MAENMVADTIEIEGFNGQAFEAYRVIPEDGGSRGGVVVIHHAPGWDRALKETARRFASLGYNVVAPNLYSHVAPGVEDAHEASNVAREQGGIPDQQVVTELNSAAEHLRGLPSSNGKVGVGGYCSGGRQAMLAAMEGDFDAAFNAYGNSVTGGPYMGTEMESLIDRIPELDTPLLGLFGLEDRNPSAESVNKLEAALKQHGKEYEFHRYEDTGHAFFSPDGRGFRYLAALDGWKRKQEFFARHLRS